MNLSFSRPILCVFLIGSIYVSIRENVFAEGSAEYPRRPIKLIVPFAAGGGSDTFGRIVRDAIEKHDLLSERLVIINVPGAGGTIGSRRVKNARPDGYTILLLHEGILTARHSGQAAYGPEAFHAIAGTSNATQVIAVAGASPHRDLKSLMRAARGEHPVVFSANIGAPSHFAGLMLESEASDPSPGASFRYTQNGGGAKRFAALQGGHVDVSAFSIAEYLQFRGSGMRALALLGPKRNPRLPELPTAREQGFDVISENMHFWWAPRGTASDRIEVLAEAIRAAMETTEVRRRLNEMSISAEVFVGESLDEQIQQREQRIASVATKSEMDLPDFPALVLLTFLGLVALAGWSHRSKWVDPNQASQQPQTEPAKNVDRESAGTLWIVAVLTVVYVALLQWSSLGFVLVTATFVSLFGGVLAIRRSREMKRNGWTVVASLATMVFTMSFAVHYLFTQVLVIDLP